MPSSAAALLDGLFEQPARENAETEGEGQPGRPPARGTEEGLEPDDLLCSRNARPQKALVGRAQWKINQPPSLKRSRASLEGWGRSRQTVLRALPMLRALKASLARTWSAASSDDLGTMHL